MISFGRKKKKILFEDKDFNSREGIRYQVNPGRGFYQVYPFDLSKELDTAYLDTTMDHRDSLCLVEICLKAYRKCEIPSEGIHALHRILEYFRRKQKDVILRFTYDLEGHAAEAEPENLEMILSHMKSLLGAVKLYDQTVLMMQGLFVGNWGEMHSSRYTTDRALKKLYETYRLSDVGYIYLAVRTPAMIHLLLNENPRIRRQMEEKSSYYSEHLRHLDKIGLFDDAMLYSEDDCGTFNRQSLQEEMGFIQEHVTKVPIGGEVLYGLQASNAYVLDHFKKLHVSYLNRQYDQRVLDQWRGEDYLDGSFYDYIEKYLGYCLHLNQVIYDPVENEIQVEVTNLGFGALQETAEWKILIEQEWTNWNMDHGEKETGISLEQEARYRVRHASLQPGKTAKWNIKINSLPKGKYHLTMNFVRFKDQRPIYFSNVNPEAMERLPIEQP